MKIVQLVVAIIDIVAFCFWMLIVIGIGKPSEFVWGPFWFHVLAWGLPILVALITLPLLPKKKR